MPVTYQFDGRTLALHLTGVYETGDVRAALLSALDDPACPALDGLLFDVSASRSINQRSAAEVRTMAQFIAAHGGRFGRRLALVAETDAAFGLMRLGAVGVEQHGVATSVFRNAAAAQEWLRAEDGA